MTDENRRENARLEMEKARTALQAARALGSLGLWDDAVSRAYYAAFHAATAALYAVGLRAATHGSAHGLLYRHYVATGRLRRSLTKDLAALQRYREQADYSTEIRFDAVTAPEEIERSARIVEEISALLLDDGVLP